MKVLKTILSVILVLLVLIILGVYIFLQSSKPVYDGNLKIAGLQEAVEVYYDNYGVPHIYANNQHDAYLALGYVHAQDRLFQMEMIRRAAAGRLSEVLGKDLLPVDRLFRTLGINQFAREHAQIFLSSDSLPYQKAALAYQQGVNAFVTDGKTPLEFMIAGIPKTKFTPEDIFLAVGFMSFGFAEGITADPVLEKIRMERGETYLRDLAVQTPPQAVRIRNFNGPVKHQGADSLISAVYEAVQKIPVPLWAGSNGWVIAGSRTTSGLPILANDTHIGFGQPAVWYEAHIEYPGASIYGHHLAGVPIALLGNNRFCAWGLTMFENDDTDFFRETTDEAHPGMVKSGDDWEEIGVREETIEIKGAPAEILKVRFTKHGPIVNDIKSDLIHDSSPITLWWQLNFQVNEALEAGYRLNHASNFEQAEKAASLFSSPGLNVMYADVAGNIAWWAAARLPVRPPHVNSKFFLDGASGKDDILGYYSFDKNPHAVNPPWGYVYSANNQPDSVEGILYPGYYFPRSRAGRIAELVSEEKKWTPEDMKSINLDVRSRMHEDIAHLLATILNESNDADLNFVADSLAQWKGYHHVNSIGPSIYYGVLGNVMEGCMRDELGKAAYFGLMRSSVIKNSYEMIIGNPDSPWWDNVNTDKKETRRDIVHQAAVAAVATLKKTSGADPSGWNWGKVHTLTHRHALGAVKPLDKIFNVGPFAAPGGSETLNNLHFTMDSTGYYEVNGGPALRKISDLSDLDHGQTVSPTGQSGNLMSPHYSDQARMYIDGHFRPMLMKRAEIQTATRKLVLSPGL